MIYRTGQIKVGADFPLKSGEVLRIRLGGTRELRVRVMSNVDAGSGPAGNVKGQSVFGTQLYYHHVGTNKDTITMVGNERKLKRV